MWAVNPFVMKMLSVLPGIDRGTQWALTAFAVKGSPCLDLDKETP